MWRQLGHGIAHGIVELALREIAGFQQIGAVQSRTGEPGPGQIRARQRGIAQIRIGEIGAIEPRIGEVGAGEIGAGEIGPGERCEAKMRAAHARGSEINRTAIHDAHLPLACAQAEARQIRHDGWILLAPSIPGARSTAQRLDMFSVGRHELQNRQSWVQSLAE